MMKFLFGVGTKILDAACYLFPAYFLIMAVLSGYRDDPLIITTSYFSSGFLLGCMTWYNLTMRKHRDKFVADMKDLLDSQWAVVGEQDKVIAAFRDQILRTKGRTD